MYQVPDVENSTAERCYLTKYDYGKRFEDDVGYIMRGFVTLILFVFSVFSVLLVICVCNDEQLPLTCGIVPVLLVLQVC